MEIKPNRKEKMCSSDRGGKGQRERARGGETAAQPLEAGKKKGQMEGRRGAPTGLTTPFAASTVLKPPS